MAQNLQELNRRGRRLVAGIPLAWLFVLFLLPFLIVLKLSFSQECGWQFRPTRRS